MTTEKHNQDDQLFVSFADILSILRRSKKNILCCAIVFGMVGFCWALIKPIRYQAEGTFREKGIKQAPLSASSSLMHILSAGGSGGANESEAASLMLSRTILGDVIEKLHLQADLQANQDQESLGTLARRNISLTLASLKNSPYPSLKDRCCSIKIDFLKYPGEIPLNLTLNLKKDGEFDVIDASHSREIVGKGKLGEPFNYQALSFILVPSDEKPIVEQTFSLRVDSLSNKAKEMAQILTVDPTKQDKSLLKIKYEHRDRKTASDIVNAVMESFQDYSKKYHGEMAMKQLDYLSQRRDHLTNNLTQLMHKHADFLANDLYGSGFIESNKEMDFLARSQHEYKRKLLDNELEIKRLTNIKLDDFTHYDRYSVNDGDPTIINNIFSEMRSIKQQRDALEIEIQKKAISQGANLQTFFEQQVNELKEVQEYFAELHEINENFKKGIFPDKNTKLFNDPRFLLKGWFDRLQNTPVKNEQEMQDSIGFYLNNLERLFGVHERILQERLTHQQNPAGEYQGISLDVATDLYRDFSKQLIQIESNIRQNTFFIHQIEDPNFEITSLSAGLNDPISSEIIHKASQLVLNLRDQNNQSIREQMRIREELLLERTFLTMHLQQMVQLMELNKQLIDEKIFALQNVSLELIHQSISVLEKNLQDYLQARLNNLHQERILIKRHLENIHTEMAQLPQKWVSEQLLTQEVTTNHLIVEEIAKLVETKNISHNLEVIQSAPVDSAIPSVHPVTPKIILLTILGVVMGAFLGSCFALAKSFSEGLRVSAQYLEKMHCHLSGLLTNPLSLDGIHVLESSLETLRRLQLYFDSARLRDHQLALPENKLLLLVEGHGPAYAHLLADLFIKRGKRVLTLDLNFHQTRESTPGLLQYLKGELKTIPIQKGEYGDWIAAGGTSPFSVEIIASQEFKKLIDQLQPSYDWILAVTPSTPCSVDAESLIPVFPFVALTLDHEKIDDLNFYIKYMKAHPNHRLTFILSRKMNEMS